MKNRRTETDLVRACLEYLAARRIMAWRNNTGAMAATHKGKTRFMRFGAPGSGDIFAILPGGRFCSIECKAPKGKVSESQFNWMMDVRNSGGRSIVVRSIEELVSALEEGGR